MKVLILVKVLIVVKVLIEKETMHCASESTNSSKSANGKSSNRISRNIWKHSSFRAKNDTGQI